MFLRKQKNTTTVFFDEKGNQLAVFNVELARNFIDRQQGLMHRNSLAKDSGMLFVFNNEQQLSFWMKNTLLSLDIIYISKDKKVVAVADNAKPCKKDPCPSYNSYQPAQYVLEINGGLAKNFGIKKGSRVEFNLP